MKQFLPIFSLIFFLFLISSNDVHAVSIKITDYPKTISTDPFEIKFSLTGAKPATNYFKINLFMDGTKDYFGETWNGNNWYSGPDSKQYLPLNITKSFNGTIKGQIGNSPLDSGSYKLKITRYTQSGNIASSDDNTPVDIEIRINKPTPAPNVASPKASEVGPSPEPTIFLEPEIQEASVLSETKEFIVSPSPSLTPTPTNATSFKKTNKNQNGMVILGVFLILSGLILSGVIFLLKYKNVK